LAAILKDSNADCYADLRKGGGFELTPAFPQFIIKINVKKSCCMQVGPRCNPNCANLQTSDGRYLPWVSEMRNLGIFVVKAHSFRCSVTQLYSNGHSLARSTVYLISCWMWPLRWWF